MYTMDFCAFAIHDCRRLVRFSCVVLGCALLVILLVANAFLASAPGIVAALGVCAMVMLCQFKLRSTGIVT